MFGRGSACRPHPAIIAIPANSSRRRMPHSVSHFGQSRLPQASQRVGVPQTNHLVSNGGEGSHLFIRVRFDLENLIIVANHDQLSFNSVSDPPF
jgi:hypothetical protein